MTLGELFEAAAQRLTAADAMRELWPQTVFGCVVCGALALINPTLLVWSLPMTAGYMLAVPLAVWSADPDVGRWAQRTGLCAIPEDVTPLPEIEQVTMAVSVMQAD